MPRAGQVVRQHPRQIQAEERRQVGPVVLGRRAQQRLGQEQHRHDREEPDRGALGRCQADLAGLPERQRGCLGAVPAHLLAPPPVDRKHHSDAAQQCDERERRPHDHRSRRTVFHPRLGRPVVGVAVPVAGTFGRRCPRRPREERRQVADLGLVGDHLRQQPVFGRVLTEVGRVVALDVFERRGLPVGEHERLGRGVVPVGPELGDDPIALLGHALCPQLISNVVGGHPQVFRGVIGPQVGAVAEHRPVLHQPAGLIQLLTAGDVGAGEEGLAGFVDHPLRHRHRRRIGPVGQNAHHQKAEDHHQGDALKPAPADQGLR